MRARVLLLAAPLFAPAAAHAQQPLGPVVITNVTVIDVERGRVLSARTVIVRGRRIAAVGAASAVHVPRGARAVDGRGKFLIPGLWDMHVHTFRNRMDAAGENTHDADVFFPAWIANGVTGVRDMSTDLADHAQIRRWAAARESGRLLAPRMVGGSPLLDGVPIIQRNALPVATAAAARRVVDSLVDGGVGFLKVYSRLSREAYFAVAEQARRRGVPLAGHVPGVVTHAEASDAGQRSFEHLNEALYACDDDLRARYDRVLALSRDSTVPRDTVRAEGRRLDELVLARFDARACAPLFARFVRNGTWQAPTMSALRLRFSEGDSATRADPRLRYVSPQLRAEWAMVAGVRPPTAEQRAQQRAFYPLRQRIVAAMQAAGVGILAGTDVHNPWIYPGFSLHDELALLVEAGLTPAQALRSATLNPARFLGATDSLGTVTRGKLADLVLLDADPLADIRNTTKIRAVVMNGRYLDRGVLDTLLAEAERAAAAPSAPHPRVPGASPHAAPPRSTAVPAEPGLPAAARAAIVGTWRLVSIIDSLPDGRTAPWMGEHPEGTIIYDASGHMSAQIMNPARPRFPGDGAAAPDSTVRAAYAGYYAYYGRYEVFPDSQVVVHHVEGSLRPAEVGVEYRRTYRLVGDRLLLRSTPERNGVRYPRWLTWERAR